jgi:transcriptional regulator with XRE-family HTH domain
VSTQESDWLSHTLRDLRRSKGLAGSAAARAVGLSQSRISRIESGVFVPTEAEIAKLADLYGAPAATKRRMVRTVRDLQAEVAPARVVLQRGAWRLQRRIARIEENAAEICGFTTTIVPGLLQTANYARVVFADGGDIEGEALDRAVAERVTRSAILSAAGRDITLIMAEGALRWQAGNPTVMVEQLGHLAKVAAEPGPRVGVIPWTRPARVFALHGFSMYDRRTVIIGTRSRTAFITDDTEVAEYAALWDELAALAVFGTDAVEIISGLAASYDSLT